MINDTKLVDYNFVTKVNIFSDDIPQKTIFDYIGKVDYFKHNFGDSYIIQTKNKNLIAFIGSDEILDSDIHKSNFELGDFYLSRKESDFKSCMPNKMSFDTVRFAVPLSLTEFEYFKLSFLPYQSFIRYRIDQEVESSHDKFMLVVPDEMFHQSSDTKTVTCHYSDSGHVIFELSIPKQLYGHNSLMYWQLDTFFERFRNYLMDCLGFEVVHWKEWLLKRIDICYNFYLDSLEEVQTTLDYLSDLRMRNRPSVRNSSGKSMAYWAFQTRTIKFYSKYNEMLVHKKSFDSKNYTQVLDGSKNILRFEEEWRSKYLLNKLNLTKVEEITVDKFINYILKDYNYNSHIIGLLGESSMVDKTFSLEETFACIKKNFKKPIVYEKLIFSIVDKGIDKTKKSMPKASYYANVKALKEVGIDVSVINERFHNGLEKENSKKPRMDFYKAPLTNINDEEAMFIQSKIEPKLDPNASSMKLRDLLTLQGVKFSDISFTMDTLPSFYKVLLFGLPEEQTQK